MAKISKEEYLTKLRAFIGEEPDDAGLEILEDAQDSFMEEATETTATLAEAEARHAEELAALEASWRKKYADRFLTPSEVIEETVEDIEKDDESSLLTFDDLFKERED